MIYGDSLEYRFVTLQPIVLPFYLMVVVKNTCLKILCTCTGSPLDSFLSEELSSFQLIMAKPWTRSTKVAHKQKEKSVWPCPGEKQKHRDKHLNFAFCFRKHTADGRIEEQLTFLV